MIDNAHYRFGSAAFAEGADLSRAGMFEARADAVMPGFSGENPLYIGGQGGIVTVGGARTGKLATVLGYTVCGAAFSNSMVIMDPKGELAAISQDQTSLGKHCVYWNPVGLHGMPMHRINPLSFIHARSPTLVSDTKIFAENALPPTGGSNAEIFELLGQRLIEGFCLTVTLRDGKLTYSALHEVINLVFSPSDAWLDFAFLMHESPFLHVRQIEEEIAQHHKSESSLMRGVLSEVIKAFACLSDPLLMASVSPPFSCDFADLVGDQRFNIYLMPPAEFIRAWAPVIKSMFVAARLTKSRAPQAPSQLWIIDECGQLGAFPAVVEMFTLGAGQNIRPWAVFQSLEQMNQLGKDAKNKIISSAATRQFFGVRDLETARVVSAMCGTQTLEFHEFRQHNSEQARREAILSMLNGGDFTEAALRHTHHRAASAMPEKQARALRTPDEILNMPPDRQLIFTDAVPKPIYAERRPYYEQRFMAGRFHPNPYHPPLDRVRVRTRFGLEWRRAIVERVPERFAHLIQYRNGYWSRIEGAP